MGCLQQCLQPAGPYLDVVVHEHHQVPARAFDAGVARDVQPQRARVWLIARPKTLGERADRR